MKSQCYRTSLASLGNFKVERCSCGAINLHVGALTLRLEPGAMEQLATTLGEAAVNNRKIEKQMAEPPNLYLVPPIGGAVDPDELDVALGQHPRETDEIIH